MRDRTFLFILIALGLVSTAEFFVIFTTISPAEANTQVFWMFFLCLFVSLSTLMALIWHPIKSWIHRSKHLSRIASLRQTTLISLVITLSIFFKSLHILTLWDIIPLAISALLIEFFFQADKSVASHEPV